MRHGRRWLVALAVFALLRSLLLGALTPPYQASDEPWHLDYARAVAEGDLPELGQTRLDPDIVAHDKHVTAREELTLYGIDDQAFSREASQPPLAYVIPAIGWHIGGGPARALQWFRAVDAATGVLLACAAFLAGRRLYPSAAWAGPVAGLVAVGLPVIALVASTANNDVLAAVFAVAAVALAGSMARDGGGLSRFVLLGAIVGVATLTKFSGLALLAPAVVAAIVAPLPGIRARAMAAAAAVGTAAAVISPWLVRNHVVYGDFLGTEGYDRFPVVPGTDIGGWDLLVADQPTAPGASRFWPELARTSVGVLRWTDLDLPPWAYVLAAASAVVAIVLVVRWLLTDASNPDRRVATVVGATVVAYVAGAAWFAMTVDYQPQGRYLIPALLAAAALAGAAATRKLVMAGTAVLVLLLGAAVATTISTFGLT